MAIFTRIITLYVNLNDNQTIANIILIKALPILPTYMYEWY